jgi:hypothetical protein
MLSKGRLPSCQVYVRQIFHSLGFCPLLELKLSQAPLSWEFSRSTHLVIPLSLTCCFRSQLFSPHQCTGTQRYERCNASPECLSTCRPHTLILRHPSVPQQQQQQQQQHQHKYIHIVYSYGSLYLYLTGHSGRRPERQTERIGPDAFRGPRK